MKILFVHNNFPAQFRHIARALASRPGIEVAAIGTTTAATQPNIRLLKYDVPRVDVSQTHPFARRFDVECWRAEQVLYNLTGLSASGFYPDIIVAHPGWGEMLPLRTVFPKARIIAYCEFFYANEGQDVGFDPEFPTTGLDGHIALHLKNAASLFALNDCDDAISPTPWQRSTFPKAWQPKIHVIHEGIDTDVVTPMPDISIRLPYGRMLTAEDEVITFVSRNLEPLRGYHVFMRALPRILDERPDAHVVIVGADGTSYGAAAPTGQTWEQIFLEEVGSELDLSRVHFAGSLSYQNYLKVLQISTAHVYLTYPFVLSWSLLEAMSAGCLVIGSDTAPVRDVINGENGLLVPFFDIERLSEQVIEALRHRKRYAAMRQRARETIRERFDLKRICLPQMESFLLDGASKRGLRG